MWEPTEMSINPFIGICDELGVEFSKKIDEFCLAGNPDVNKLMIFTRHEIGENVKYLKSSSLILRKDTNRANKNHHRSCGGFLM